MARVRFSGLRLAGRSMGLLGDFDGDGEQADQVVRQIGAGATNDLGLVGVVWLPAIVGAEQMVVVVAVAAKGQNNNTTISRLTRRAGAAKTSVAAARASERAAERPAPRTSKPGPRALQARRRRRRPCARLASRLASWLTGHKSPVGSRKIRRRLRASRWAAGGFSMPARPSAGFACKLFAPGAGLA